MLSVIMLSVIMLRVIMLSVIMLKGLPRLRYGYVASYIYMYIYSHNDTQLRYRNVSGAL